MYHRKKIILILRALKLMSLGYNNLEMMSLREMGPQLKLPTNVMKGSTKLQCNTYFPQILAI